MRPRKPQNRRLARGWDYGADSALRYRGAPAREEAITASALRTSDELAGAHLVDWLPAGSWIVFVELPDMLDEGRHYLGRLDNPRGFYGVEATFKRCIDFPTVTIAAISGESAETVCHLKTESVERFAVPAPEVMGELAKVVGRDEQVMIACHNSGERERLTELLSETDLPTTGRVVLCEGHVLHGFRLVSDRLIVISDHELFGRRDIRRAGPKTRTASVESRAIDSFLELSEGHLVVHLTKGIARYRGMQMLGEGDRQEEHLVLEFRDGVKVFVPASLIHLVLKYVGGAKSTPTLSKIGSNSWEHKKQAVAEAVADLAGDMVTLQAARAAKPGIAFPPDSHWQDEFEASFPYTETDDQLSGIAAIKGDMQTARPMDRLICGDVGYGKTELAMRAAFKAIRMRDGRWECSCSHHRPGRALPDVHREDGRISVFDRGALAVSHTERAEEDSRGTGRRAGRPRDRNAPPGSARRRAIRN